MKKPTMLMILDGYGLNDSAHGNAIAAAKKPNLDRIFDTYPHTRIDASGLAVGLPEGQMGNSEVGHLNIGAGRIVYQELTKITKAIQDGVFFDNIPLNNACDHVLATGGALHLYGLLSDGGVHSHFTTCRHWFSWPSAVVWKNCLSTALWTAVMYRQAPVSITLPSWKTILLQKVSAR